MLKISRWLTILVWGVLVLAAMFAAPNLLPEKLRDELPGFMPKGTINLGLDLQGGSYLLLGVDTEKVVADRLTSLKQELQREMRPEGGKERVVLATLPAVNAKEGIVSFRVRDAAQAEEGAKRARDITRQGVLPGAPRPYEVTIEGPRVDVKITPDAKRQYSQQALADSIEVVRRRIDPAGNKEVAIAPQGSDRIVVQVPGDNDPEALKALINRTGQLSFHRADPSVSVADAEAGVPGRIVVPFAASEQPGGAMVLYEDAEVTGDMVQSASAGLNDQGGGFQINFAFDGRGARRFAEYTRDHVGEVFAIVLDNEIISAPVIQTPITGGSGRITGNFSSEEATRIATLIRSGALPAPLTTLEQRSVGPQLGRDSIEAGRKSLIIAFGAISLYMIWTYGLFGVFATIALFANVILIGACLSLFGSTLTLPGIAGVVLTIGMAVDANVLIFERIREELHAGKGVVSAVELGFGKALSAIIDSNLTTFFAALIMFWLGAGPVRGFAITLAVGVVTSVFSAYMLTRMMAGTYVLGRRPKHLAI